MEEKERELVQQLERKSFRWQLQVEIGCLAGLLRNEKAVAPLLKFSKTTGIRGIGGRRRGSWNKNGRTTKKGKIYLDKIMKTWPKRNGRKEENILLMNQFKGSITTPTEIGIESIMHLRKFLARLA